MSTLDISPGNREELHFISQDLPRKLIVSKSTPKQLKGFISKNKFESMKKATELTISEEEDAIRKRIAKEKAILQEELEKRRQEFEVYDLARKKNEKLSELEEEAKQKMEYFREKANEAIKEQNEEMKEINKISCSEAFTNLKMVKIRCKRGCRKSGSLIYRISKVTLQPEPKDNARGHVPKKEAITSEDMSEPVLEEAESSSSVGATANETIEPIKLNIPKICIKTEPEDDEDMAELPDESNDSQGTMSADENTSPNALKIRNPKIFIKSEPEENFRSLKSNNKILDAQSLNNQGSGIPLPLAESSNNVGGHFERRSSLRVLERRIKEELFLDQKMLILFFILCCALPTVSEKTPFRIIRSLEGDSVLLPCYPRLEDNHIQWYKTNSTHSNTSIGMWIAGEGKSSNEYMERISIVNKAELCIFNIEKSDQGYYLCITKYCDNDAWNATATIVYLNIIETSLTAFWKIGAAVLLVILILEACVIYAVIFCISYKRPRILIFKAEVGTNITLKFDTSNVNGSERVVWSRHHKWDSNSIAEEPHRDININQFEISEHYYLVIHNVQLENHGFYNCTCVNRTNDTVRYTQFWCWLNVKAAP